MAAGFQGGASGFITAGGTVIRGVAVSIGTAVASSYAKCGEVDLVNVAISSTITLGSSFVGRFAPLLVPTKRIHRNGLMKWFEDNAFIDPKFVPKNPNLAKAIQFGSTGGLDGYGQGLFSGASAENNCECE